MQAMRWREAGAAIAALFVVSRGILVLLALFLENNIPLGYAGPAFDERIVLRSLTGSDSVYLLGIAAEGYHAEPVSQAFRDWAFFPLYPLVTRAASVLTLGDITIAGILVANLAFVAALAVLYRLALNHLDHDRAVRSLAFVTFAPGAVAFAMAYTDSLFLLLAAGAFLAAEHRRWWLMAVLYGLATLTRAQGLLIGLPLAVLIANDMGGWRHVESWRSRRMFWLLAGPLGFGAFALLLGLSFGEPFGMLKAQEAWSNIGRPATGNTTPVLDRFDPIVLLLIGILCLYTFLLVYLRHDRFPAAHVVLVAVMWIGTFGAMFLNTSLLQSVARYMAVAWPFSWVLAKRKARWFELVGLAGLAALFVVFAALHFTQALAP
ncbi:MAG: hypothetical protein FIA92_04385 [Chloroflexi bacterium]|nr:hypothetical protein [Chloroflexota bacterium]